MTTRKKKEFPDLEGLEQSLTDETVELNTTYPSVEDHSEVLVETQAEKEEKLEPITEVTKRVEEIKVEVIEQQPIEAGPRPPAPAKRKPSKNTPKFSFKFR